MELFRLEDPAWQTWRSLVSSSPQFTLTTVGPRLFLEKGDENGWGPLMMLHPITSQRLRQYCDYRPIEIPATAPRVLRLRALQFFAEYTKARKLLTATDSYCGSIDEYVRGISGPFTTALASAKMDMPRWRFLAFLHLTRVSLQITRDRGQALHWLQAATESLTDLTESSDFSIAMVRLLRYRSELENVDVEQWLENTGVLRSSNLVLMESVRRLCDFHTLLRLKKRDFLGAERTAKIAFELDPNCSRAAFLLGECRIRTGRDAKRFFIQASLNGFDERELSEKRLTGLDEDILSFKSMQPVTRATELRDKIRSSPRFADLEIFWNHQAVPGEKSPLLTYTPLLSRQSYLEGRNPFFKTLTCQRVINFRFRTEMVHLLLPETQYKQQNLDQALAFNFWQSFNPGLPEETDQLRRSLKARYLSSMGFYEDAFAQIKKPAIRSPEDAYEYSTWIFLREIRTKTPTEEVQRQVRDEFPTIPDTAETLRIRLTLNIFATVYFGNNRSPLAVRELRESGLRLLSQIQNAPEFTEFEKQLLTTRYYRACSYAPFMFGDRKTLAADAAIIESVARGLQPTDQREKILARENCYPMLETSSRIHSYLGNYERAYELMIEIAREIDPYDGKAWLQTGEVEAARGNADAALAAFTRAAELGLPMGRIAWYKCGRLHEKRGELELALHCYIKSLRAWPHGPSPLMRVRAIAPRLGWNHLEHWATAQLEKIS